MAPRIIAGLAAALLWLAALCGAVIAFFLALSAAEPGVANGRGETLSVSLALALFEGLLVAAATLTTVYAATGRLPFWPWLVGLPLAISVPIGLLAGLSL